MYCNDVGRGIRRTKVPSMTLTWTVTYILSHGASFRPNRIVLLAEFPPQPQHVIDVNDNTMMCDTVTCDALASEDNVAAHSTGDMHEEQKQQMIWAEMSPG